MKIEYLLVNANMMSDDKEYTIKLISQEFKIAVSSAKVITLP